MQTENDDYLLLGEIAPVRNAEEAKKKRQRWVLKLLYFVQTGAAAGLVKFLPVFFAKRLDLSATEIGITLVVGNVANFVGGVFWGRLADVTGRYKMTMVVTNAASVFFNFCLLANSVTNTFWLFLCDFVLASFFGSCWGTLVDAVAVIGSDAGSSYGKLRLWAAIGWGTLSLATGYLIDLTDIGIIFATFGVGMAIAVILVMLFFSDPEKLKQRQKQQPSPDAENFDLVVKEADLEDSTTFANNEPTAEAPRSSGAELRAILCRTEVALLLTNLFVQGVLVAFVESFLYVYLAQVYKVPGFFMGLCTCVAAAFECPVFFYSEELLKTLGIKGVLTLAQFLYAVRVWAYTYIPNNSSASGYWLFLLTEPLHAFVFAAMWSAAVEYSRLLAPSEHQGTMQALVRGLYYFIGNGVGSVLGGLIIDSKGGGAAGFHLMYRFGGTAMAIWSVTWHLLMCLDASCYGRKNKGPSPTTRGEGVGSRNEGTSREILVVGSCVREVVSPLGSSITPTHSAEGRE